jgi:UDP-N-acetylmuramate dehydrogenase
MKSLPQFQVSKLLKDVSTFGIGGPARLFVEINTIEEMQATLAYCNNESLPFFILGKGSNILFHDQGFDGLVIHNKISYLTIHGSEVDVGAGYSFAMLGFKTAKQGLGGLEFASGIPATVGGAVYMNAGAGGYETKDFLTEVTFVDGQGNLSRISKQDLGFGYRYSSFQKTKGAIVAAKFCLVVSEEARKKQLSIVEYRTKTQPYGELSAGCVFKNPINSSAGALIEQSGLKGLSVGDAEVSTKHANFIVNRKGARAEDVLLLAKQVKERVKEKTGIELEMEVRCIPYQISQ